MVASQGEVLVDPGKKLFYSIVCAWRIFVAERKQILIGTNKIAVMLIVLRDITCPHD
jgi:hypothetical protein